MRFESIVRSASRLYFWPSADREDVEQEARLALLRAQPQTPALARVVVHRHLIEQVRRETRRRPQYVALPEQAASGDLVELVDARDRLRRIVSTPLSGLERVALGRALRGEGCSEKALDNALQRARKKVAA